MEVLSVSCIDIQGATVDVTQNDTPTCLKREHSNARDTCARTLRLEAMIWTLFKAID
jgi:hypothetical protein